MANDVPQPNTFELLGKLYEYVEDDVANVLLGYVTVADRLYITSVECWDTADEDSVFMGDYLQVDVFVAEKLLKSQMATIG